MSLFKLDNNNLKYIKETPFQLEKDIQSLCEKNMKELLNCEFVKTEFVIENFRFDSIGFDKSTSSFVIIEYKRDKNFSVIDQGFAYLSVMLNHKSDIILEYNETTGKNLKRTDVDWTQSKVVFVSPSFTTYQKEAIGFKDLPIELYEIKRYANGTVSFTQVLSKNTDKAANVISEIKVYTEDDRKSDGSQAMQELYEKLKTMILNIGDDITIKPQKIYIAFVRKTNFCDITIQKNQLKVWLNLKYGKLEDSKNITRNVSNIGHHGNGDYELTLSSDSNIEYIVSLIRQAYNINE